MLTPRGTRVLTAGVAEAVESPLQAVRVEAPTEKFRLQIVWAGWLFVGLGCVLRLLQYGANRSLAIDESFLALNLIEKSHRQLLGALDFSQAAPLGFLQAEKLLIAGLGRNEFALRLLPLVASLLAVVLFYLVAKKMLRPAAATLSVAVFALLDPLIIYSAATKQYALDVLGAVLILWAAEIIDRTPLRGPHLVALGASGAILVWFSHAAAFGLAALSVLVLLRMAESRTWAETPVLLGVVAAWVGSFAIQYMLSRSNLEEILGGFQQAGGAAFQPAGSGPTWFTATIDRGRYLVGMEDVSGEPVLSSLAPEVNRGLTMLIVLVGVVGFVSVFRQHARFALMLALPPCLAVVTSTLGQYPLVGRTLLFALPSVALSVGAGLDLFLRTPSRRSVRALSAVLALTCIAAIAVAPASHLMRPRSTQDMKEALRYLGANHQTGDALYLSRGAQYAFAYYHLCDCSPFDPATEWPFSVVSGSTVAVESRSPELVVETSGVRADMKPMLGRERVWVLLAEMFPAERTLLLDHLESRGTLRQRFEARGSFPAVAWLHLYDLTSSRG